MDSSYHGPLYMGYNTVSIPASTINNYEYKIAFIYWGILTSVNQCWCGLKWTVLKSQILNFDNSLPISQYITLYDSAWCQLLKSFISELHKSAQEPFCFRTDFLNTGSGLIFQSMGVI